MHHSPGICRKGLLALPLAAYFACAGAVQLENWRFPFYNLAADMGLAKTSPSRMFWDNIGGSELFHLSLWPDSARYAENHWTIEPSFASGSLTPAYDGQQPQYWHVDLLNNIRYRNLLVRQTLDVDMRYEYDPLYPAHKGRGARGRIEEAYLQLDIPHSFVRLGRMKRNWGPFADRSLLLSTNPYSYDALEFQVHASMFEFRHLFAAFPSKYPQLDMTTANFSRYFAVHALNVMLGPWLTLGVFESVIFTRTQGIPDIQYINPFSIYSVINTNQEGDANLMLGFQTEVRPLTDRVSIRVQIALDDFQVDDSIATDKEPTHWGLDAGVFWRDPLPISLRNLVKAEYTLRSEWLYTVPDTNTAQGERYTYAGKSLGLPEVDGDAFTAALNVVGKNFWAGSVAAGYARQGANRLANRWLDSDSGNTSGLPYDYLKTAFPSGIVEQTASLRLEGIGYFLNFSDLRVGIENRWIKNRDNIATGTFEYLPRFYVEASAHFSNFFFMLPQ